MAMNPGNLFKIMQMKNRFTQNHPKAAKFLATVIMSGLPEGTLIEMRVLKPGEDPIEANMKVTADDIAMMNELKGMQQ